jgi:hypothetical protein
MAWTGWRVGMGWDKRMPRSVEEVEMVRARVKGGGGGGGWG